MLAFNRILQQGLRDYMKAHYPLGPLWSTTGSIISTSSLLCSKQGQRMVVVFRKLVQNLLPMATVLDPADYAGLEVALDNHKCYVDYGGIKSNWNSKFHSIICFVAK